MDEWKVAWKIVEEQIACRACGVQQPVEDAHRPFKHEANCVARSSAAQMPWRDLAALLREDLLRRPAESAS